MASNRFQVMYPSKGYIGLDGGLNTKFDKQLIADNESPDCLNVIYGNGSVETRGGTSKLNTATVGTFVCDGLYTRHDSAGGQTMTAWFGGTLYACSATSFITVASSQSLWTAGVRVSSAEYENYRFYGNGGAIPAKYNGVTFARHGVYPPTTTMTAATAPTGTALTGQFRYKVSYVNSNLVESDVGPATSTFTAASENVKLTSIPVAPASFGVNARYLYRTVTSGAVFKRLASISDNTTTTYEDAIADASLGADAPDDQGVPPRYSVIVYHQARLFMIDPVTNLVWYTELGNPYVVKAENFRRIGDTSGEIPKTLAVYDNGILVGCANGSTWLIYMPDSDDANWIDVRLKTDFGSKSPFGWFYFNNRLMMPAMQNGKFVGFAVISGNSIEPTATLLTTSSALGETYSDKIESQIFEIQETYVGNISAIVHKNKAYITCTYGAGNLTNNRIYFFDFSQENMSKDQKFMWTPWTGLNAAQFAEFNGDLYYATSTATGFVYKMNTDTYSDDGAAINSYYWTKEFFGEPGHEGFHKDWRWLNMLYELSGNYNMNLTTRVDSTLGSGAVVKEIDLTPGASAWGTLRWGLDTWEPGQETDDNQFSLGIFSGKRIQFRFSNQNTVNQKFKILGISLMYNLKGKR